MLQIPESIFKRRHSAAWITPEGEFISLTANQHHTSVAADFPGMPTDNKLAEEYPSTWAVARMHYVKVSNPFQCAWDGRGGRSDPRMGTMSDYMAQATVWLSGQTYNPWHDGDVRGDLTRTKVYVTEVTSPDPYAQSEREDLTVGDFVDRYGGRDTIDFLYGNLIGESFIRACRMIERRILGSAGLNERVGSVDGDRLYRTIVGELRRSIS
jgi:hypothetical protein